MNTATRERTGVYGIGRRVIRAHREAGGKWGRRVDGTHREAGGKWGRRVDGTHREAGGKWGGRLAPPIPV
jgi:hypothetical protein